MLTPIRGTFSWRYLASFAGASDQRCNTVPLCSFFSPLHKGCRCLFFWSVIVSMPIRETFFGNTARHLASLPLCRRRLEKALASMYKPLAHAPPVTKVNLSPHPTSITHRPPKLGSQKLFAFCVEASSRVFLAHEERIENSGAMDRLEDVSRPAVN